MIHRIMTKSHWVYVCDTNSPHSSSGPHWWKLRQPQSEYLHLRTPGNALWLSAAAAYWSEKKKRERNVTHNTNIHFNPRNMKSIYLKCFKFVYKAIVNNIFNAGMHRTYPEPTWSGKQTVASCFSKTAMVRVVRRGREDRGSAASGICPTRDHTGLKKVIPV